MKKYVQNIERLFAGQTANALVLSQIDEDFPVLIPSIGDNVRGIPAFVDKWRRTYPDFNPPYPIADVAALNSYIVDFNLGLQDKFKSRAHEELYMMDDTMSRKPISESSSISSDKTYMHAAAGMDVDSTMHLAQLNSLFPARKTTAKSMFQQGLKVTPVQQMDDVFERFRQITLQGRVSYEKCLQAVAQAGNQLYLLSPNINVSDYIYSNGQVILNDFGIFEEDIIRRMNPIPNSFTLFQPGGNQYLKSTIQEFIDWYEQRNHKVVVDVTSLPYGSNTSILNILGNGSYEIGLATYGPTQVIVQNSSSQEMVELNSSSFRRMKANTHPYGKKDEESGKFIVGNSTSKISGFMFNLYDTFITGQERKLKVVIPRNRDSNMVKLEYCWEVLTDNGNLPPGLEVQLWVNNEMKVFDGTNRHKDEQPLPNAVLQDNVVEFSIIMHYDVDFNKRQTQEDYAKTLKCSGLALTGISLKMDGVADEGENLTFGSYVNESGIDEAEHERRLQQFWTVSRYKNDVSYQSVLETSIRNTSSAGIRSPNNYSTGDIYGDMFLTKSLLDPEYNMDIDARWFNQTTGQWVNEGDEGGKPVLRTLARNYINLISCSNQLTLVYRPSEVVIGEDEYGRTYGQTVPWHDWDDSSSSSMLQNVLITWDSWGGTHTDPWILRRGAKLKDAGKDLPVPIRGGYQFMGWWTMPQEDDMTTRSAPEQVTEDTIVNDSVTFYAKWQLSSSSSALARTFAQMSENDTASSRNGDIYIEEEGMSHMVSGNVDYGGLKYQMVETVRNINRFESSIKHKPNVFSVVVENSNLAPDDSDSRDERLEDFKKHLRDSVSQFVRNACRDVAPVHTQLFDVQFT